MKIRLHCRIGGWLAIGAFLLGSCWRAVAQRYVEQEPELAPMPTFTGSLGVYAEGTDEEVHYQSGVSSTSHRYFEGPLLGFGINGSIYHPNLLQYDLSTDGALGWTEEKITTSTGASINRSYFDFLGNFSGNSLFLAQKPYAAHFFVTHSHTYRDYDFFNRVTVDSTRYGVTSGYDAGPVPVRATLTRYDETTSGFGFGTGLQETTLNLDAHNDRATGRSTLNYNFQDINRTVGSTTISGVENSVGFSDSENFGSPNVELRNSAAYAKRNFTDSAGDTITAASRLEVEHPYNLKSAYDANFLRDKTDDTITENYDGGAGIQHQLFASLTSGLRVQAIRYTSERPGSEFESTEYIGTWSESYTKKLSSTARLIMGGALSRSHTDQRSSSTFQIVGEAHTFSSGGPFLNSFYLNVLNANATTVEIYDQSRTTHYTRDVDYTVTTVGAQTLIQLIQPNPSGLTSTTPIVVDYQAAPQGSGSIDGNTVDAQVRLELMEGMWGIYGRYNSSDYTAPAGIIVQNVTGWAFGVDFARKWFRAGAEYQIYDSTFSAYTAARFYQTLSFNPDDASSLSVSFSEGWTDYQTGNRTEQYYSAISRYHRGLTRRLALDLEGGVTERTGTVIDEMLAAVRPSLSYDIGKLSFKAGYDFEYQDTQHTQQRVKHSLFISARRSF